MDLEKFKEKRRLENVSDVTINIDVRTLKAAIQLALDWKLIQEHPFEKAKPIRTTQKTKSYFTDEEIVKLLNAIKDEWFAGIVKFAILTGLRRGEILNLTWGDFDTKSGNITHPILTGLSGEGWEDLVRFHFKPEGIALLGAMTPRKKEDKIFTYVGGAEPVGRCNHKEVQAGCEGSGTP